MTHITKALIVDQPWIDLILSGRKTWEMRGTATAHRGPFALIRKGSGQVVGVARMIGCGSPLSQSEMIATIERHHIPERMILSGVVAKWTTPWHLADARLLARPVRYRHPSGAVTWVKLDPEVIAAIATQMEASPLPMSDREMAPAEKPLPIPPQPARSEPAASRGAVMTLTREEVAARDQRTGTGAWLGEVTITEGNLKNNHFYLRSFLGRFPEGLINGRAQPVPVRAKLEAEGMTATETDICPRHLFFRDRSWTRSFFATHDARAGDRLQVHQTAPLRYRISLLKG